MRTTRHAPIVLPVLVLLAAALAADAPRTPSILALMHKEFTVTRSPFKVLKKEAEAPAPDWDRAREAAGRFSALADALAKNTPLWGTPETWSRHVGRHVADARAMEEAARDRDPVKLRAAHQRIAASCTACHRDHRSRRGG